MGHFYFFSEFEGNGFGPLFGTITAEFEPRKDRWVAYACGDNIAFPYSRIRNGPMSTVVTMARFEWPARLRVIPNTPLRRRHALFFFFVSGLFESSILLFKGNGLWDAADRATSKMHFWNWIWICSTFPLVFSVVVPVLFLRKFLLSGLVKRYLNYAKSQAKKSSFSGKPVCPSYVILNARFTLFSSRNEAISWKLN